MRTLTEQQMIDIIWGATLMGGGGGGSISSGMDLLNAYKRDHPDAKIEVDLITVDEMKGGYAAATAGMGAPAAIVGVDFSKYAANAFSLLQEVAARHGKDLRYNIPVELGGFSIFFPLLLSLITEFKTVDADGAGRAVPALETLLLHVNGCPTSPIALANGVNDKITVELADSHNAPLAEKIGRDICGEFGNMVGISGWLVDKTDIENRIITGSITLCEKIGAIMRRANCPAEKLFEMLASEKLVQSKVVCVGDVTDIRVETHGGFDYGTLDVTDGTNSYWVNFQNENLLLQKKTDAGYEDLMTVPDLTCMYCVDPAGAAGVDPRMPLSNADVKKGMKIALGVIKVDPKWFLTENTWWDVWKECFAHIGYTGGYLSYDDVKV